MSYATNGIEAVKLFRDHQDTITQIFMDIQMPEKDGITATKEIRKLEIKGHHVLIFCTSSQSDIEGTWKKAQEAGMDLAIGKQLSPRRICDTLQKKAECS